MVGDKAEHRCTLIAVSLPLFLLCVSVSVCAVCVCLLSKPPITTNPSMLSSILAGVEDKDSSPERSHQLTAEATRQQMSPREKSITH